MEISTMKVKIYCCNSCQKKAKKILEKADGVQAICIDIGDGLLTVTGDVEPFLLIDMVEKKVRKKVELWSFRRYPAHGSTEEGGRGGGYGWHHKEVKVDDLRRARERKKAAHRGADRGRAAHAYPAHAGPCWPGPGVCHPMARPCQHHGDPELWGPHVPPPPMCCGPPLFPPPPHHWCNPMPPPPMQPPPPYHCHHEARRPKK